MSHTPNYDAKIKAILDATKPGERVCELTGEKWEMTEEEISWYKKFQVPPSPFSPLVRMWHLASLMTVYQWWWNKHKDTNIPVLTYIHPATGMRVLPDKEWFTRDFTDTTVLFSTEKPFFELFRDLQLQVPMNATRNVVEPENSIATVSLGGKNSFFVHGSKADDSLYLADVENAQSTVDANGSSDLMDCYHVNHCQRMHHCFFVYESRDCLESAFLFDCRNCEYCFGATNKRNRKYLWWNEQLTKEEWEKRREKVRLGLFEELKNYKQTFFQIIGSEAVWPDNFNNQVENCSGDYLTRCFNCKDSLLGYDASDNWWCIAPYRAKINAFAIPIQSEFNYQSGMVGNTFQSKFSSTLIRCDDMEYSFNCYDCQHCFGCVGLRHQKYCIFNKSYFEEEYWQKVDELKCAMLDRGEYGRPFPLAYSFSYFPESGIVMYLAAHIDMWEKTGMLHFDVASEGAFGEGRMQGRIMKSSNEIPTSIELLTDDWINTPIFDEQIQRPFSYLKSEVEFYRKHKLAPPHEHFITRIRNLFRSSNSMIVEELPCALCGKKIKTSKNPIFPSKKVYCQSCYLEFLEKYA